MKYFYYLRLSKAGRREVRSPGIPFPIIHATPLATFDLSPSIA
jgi:hypothetical protein